LSKSETAKIIAFLKLAYPRFCNDAITYDNTVKLWAAFFSEPFETVQAACACFIANDTKGFPPIIGQIKDWIYKNTVRMPTEIQAWGVLSKSLEKNYGGNSKEIYEKLPKTIKTLVSYHLFCQWSDLNIETRETVIASNFMRSYRDAVKQKREYTALSSGNISMKMIEGDKA